MAAAKTSSKYLMVSSKTALRKVIKTASKPSAKYGMHCALDFETTALRPAEGRVRLVSLCNEHVSALVDFDKIKGGFPACASMFTSPDRRPVRWAVFNRGFEQRWFDAAGSPEVRCIDLANLRRSKLGGSTYSLANLALWDLGIELDKDEQTSDWNAPKLTKKQLDYAFLDADVTWQLWSRWWKETDDDHKKGMVMLDQMNPAVIEMEDTGMLLDQEHHWTLIKIWEKHKALRVKRIRKLVDETEVKNINSDQQWSDYFARLMPDHFLAGWPRTPKSGHLSMKGEVLTMLAGAVLGTPLEKCFDALSEYKTISKYLSSFGETLINKANLDPDGRVRASYRIAAARTCRFSSAGPNLQQVPRDKELLGDYTSIRQSFIAGPGRVLVSLDYSGIELRVLAILSGDAQLLEDCIYGDVHLEVATVMNGGRPVDKTTRIGKALRQGAKGVSFGIIYGAGASGLANSMRTSQQRAAGYIDFWERRYPLAFDYRSKMMAEAEATGFIRGCDGGSMYMGKKPELPKCANYNVQRGALVAMSHAMTIHKEDLDRERAAGKLKTTRMISTIHDALIDECARRDGKRVLRLMDRAMVAGYKRAFPGAPIDRLVEGGIGPNWGALE